MAGAYGPSIRYVSIMSVKISGRYYDITTFLYEHKSSPESWITRGHAHENTLGACIFKSSTAVYRQQDP
jgi:hypothetical protein